MDSKWIMKSKTFWGIAIAVVGMVATQFGWTWWADVQGDATNIFNMGLEIFGSALALYGRFKADKPATLIP